MTTNFGSLPHDIQPLMTGLLDSVYEMLADNGQVSAAWFMVDRRNSRMMPIMAAIENEQEKYDAAHMVRYLVKQHQPHVDAVIFICEAWRKDLTREQNENRTTRVRDMPGREDVVMFIVETYDGYWIASPVVTSGKTKRTLATVKFEYEEHYSGEMAHYLPPRKASEVN